jgi:hypothetical protein
MALDFGNAVQETVYVWYRNREGLPGNIVDGFTELGEKFPETLHDQDYSGFVVGEFEPYAIDKFTEAVGSDPGLKAEILDFAATKKAVDLLGMKASACDCIRWAGPVTEKVERLTQTYGPPPLFQVHFDLLGNYYCGDIDITTFRFYGAARSIEGSKKFCRTHKSVLVRRAFGCKDKAMRGQLSPSQEVEFQRLSSKYWIHKILDRLQAMNLIVKGHDRTNIYVSTKLTIKEFTDMMKTSKTDLERVRTERQSLNAVLMERQKIMKTEMETTPTVTLN